MYIRCSLRTAPPLTGGRDGVAFSHVSFLTKAQCVQLRLEGTPIDDLWGSKFISHKICHRLSPLAGALLFPTIELDLVRPGRTFAGFEERLKAQQEHRPFGA